jgi:hypothetical protein
VKAPRASSSLSVCALLAAGCVQSYPQRVPGPLFDPAGEAGAAAPAEVAVAPSVDVQRASDPVWLRLPGERGERALAFHAKRERVPVGTLVRTGAGGRVELLWSPDATAIALFDECRATLGDPERDQPLLTIHSLSRALLVLTPEDRIELLGGARLAGDALETTGPVSLERLASGLVRVSNQSKRLCTLAYRDARLELGPGESLDLPELPAGAAPLDEGPEPQRFEHAGLAFALRGALEREDRADGARLTAREPSHVRALGVSVRLAPDEAARFSGLTLDRGAPPADPNARSSDPNTPQ